MTKSVAQYLVVDINLVQPNPWQTRPIDEARVQRLVDSIKEMRTQRPETMGLLQVPAARIVIDGKVAKLDVVDIRNLAAWLRQVKGSVQIVFGHHRLEAFKRLAESDPAYRKLPVTLVVFDDEAMSTAAWTENEERGDLSPIERAHAIRKMMSDFGWTQAQAADKLRLKRATVANILRLLDLPGSVQAKVNDGKLSERQAIAALPALTLPAEALEELQDDWTYRQFQEALERGASSDELRDDAANIVRIATEDLSKATFPLDQAVEGEGIKSSTCAKCSLRKGNQCAAKKCYQFKADTWMTSRLGILSQTTGLPYVSPELYRQEHTYERKWKTFSSGEYGHGEQAALDKALATKCPHLHIGPHRYGGALGPQKSEPDIAYVCRRPGQCTCRKAAAKEAVKAEGQDKVAADQEVLNAIRQQAVEEICVALKEGRAWRAIIEAVVYDKAERHKIEAIKDDPDALLSFLARHLLPKDLFSGSGDANEVAADVSQWLGDNLNGFEGLNPLEDIARRLERIEKWMAELTSQFPTEQQVRGNLANLGRLSSRLRRARDKESVEPILARVTALAGRLYDIQEAMGNWQEDGQGADFAHVALLVAGDDKTFKKYLAKAALPVLRYAQALVADGRCEAIAAHIAELEERKQEEK